MQGVFFGPFSANKAPKEVAYEIYRNANYKDLKNFLCTFKFRINARCVFCTAKVLLSAR